MSNDKKITTWSIEEPTQANDPQQAEIQQQQATSKAYASLGSAIAKEERSNADYKTETSQLGKWPRSRWFTHPWVGRDSRKGIADILFLSWFGDSSATDSDRSRKVRAAIRVVLTVVVVGGLSALAYWLTHN